MISSSEDIKSQSLKFSKSKRLTKCQQWSAFGLLPPPPLVSLCQHLHFVSHSFEKKTGAQSIHELDASRKSCRPPWRFWAGGGDCTNQREKLIDSSKL